MGRPLGKKNLFLFLEKRKKPRDPIKNIYCDRIPNKAQLARSLDRIVGGVDGTFDYCRRLGKRGINV